jgi:glycosyltransferase involved in cell wall biosynthesis
MGRDQPNGWHIRTGSPVAACDRALNDAADARRPLLVLTGGVEPSCEAIGSLVEAIAADPMFGFAIARVAGVSHDSLARLDIAGDPAIAELPRRLLSEIADTYLVADAPGYCMLIKPVVVANFGELDKRFRSVSGALWHYTARARRCGFRTVVCNRAVIGATSAARAQSCVIPLQRVPEADRVLLRELMPDLDRAREEFGPGAVAQTETRLARALPRAYDSRPSLLLDARNVICATNGTAVAALGISGGLHALRSPWDVTLLASRDACEFHGLERMFPDWQVTPRLPERQFTAALRLSQPWQIQEMLDLHSAAAYNIYAFLDTISWDTAYPAPRHLDGTWRFMADHADGLVFISHFTRDRFRRRFGRGTLGVPDLVSHLSFDPDDYVHPAVQPASEENAFFFVVGNDYDHKDIGPSVELLTTAFPYQPIAALGGAVSTTPRVSVFQSGKLSDVEIHRLYSGAGLIVFPSFYEGFGLPILTALAYGRTVLARRSALLDEIAARSAPRGRLVPFDRREDLVELIGRLRRGEHVAELPLGTALNGGRPSSWQDAGKRILTFLTTLTSDLSLSRWRSRDHILRQLTAAPRSLVDRELQWSQLAHA